MAVPRVSRLLLLLHKLLPPLFLPTLLPPLLLVPIGAGAVAKDPKDPAPESLDRFPAGGAALPAPISNMRLLHLDFSPFFFGASYLIPNTAFAAFPLGFSRSTHVGHTPHLNGPDTRAAIT